jgi:hypothetical protein
MCSSEKECPNFMESWWQEGGQGQPKIIQDCVPKRILIQQQTEVNRMFALQQAVEQMRNRLEKLEGLLGQLIDQSRNYMVEQSQKKIPKKPKRREVGYERSSSS